MKRSTLYATAAAAALFMVPCLVFGEDEATPDSTPIETPTTELLSAGDMNGEEELVAPLADDTTTDTQETQTASDVEKQDEVEDTGSEVDPVVVEDIYANTQVGDGQREATSFEVVVSDESKYAIQDLTADDFDVIHNVGTTVFEPGTTDFLKDFEDDGIKVSVDGNKLTLEVNPFNWNGTYQGEPWQVICKRYNALTFGADDIKEKNIRTKTLDDAIRGTYNYAGLEREYALYLPKNEDGSVKKNVSIVIWNHGGGEYNGDLEKTLVANRGLTAWPEAGYDTAVLQVQIANPNYSWGTAPNASEELGGTFAEKEARRKLIDQNNALQAAIVRDLIKMGIVDANRVYVTGASSGGGATMRFVMQYPELFAGAIACCSHDPIVWVHKNDRDSYDEIVENFKKAFQSTVYTWDAKKGEMVEVPVNTEALINVPIYFTHAENDPTCSSNSSKAMYQALAELGAKNNKIRIFSDEEMLESGLSGPLLHWSWVKVLNGKGENDPMTWLFEQTKETAAKPSVTPLKPAGTNTGTAAAVTPNASVDTSSKISLSLAALGMTISGLGAALFTRKKHD